MSAIGSWLLSIIGIVIIGSLIDIVLPEGTISKYIKGIYSLIVIFVIINPLIQLFDNKIQLNNNYEMLVDEQFLNLVQEDKINYLEANLTTQLKLAGLKNVEIKIQAKNSENALKIDTVYVFFNNLVIDKKDEHIDKYQVAEDIILNNLKIDKEQIIYYEWWEENNKR